MGNKTVFYKMLKTDMLNMLLFCIGFSFFAGIITAAIGDELIAFESYFAIVIIFSNGGLQSYGAKNRYFNFAYSRKRFFKYQSILVLFRAALIATIHTAIRLVCYDSYVNGFIEETEYTIDMYQPVPVVELWVFHWFVYIAFFLYLLVSSTALVSVVSMPENDTPVIQERKANRKAKSRLYRFFTYIGIGGLEFIGLVAVTVGMIYIYEALLTHEFAWRLSAMAVVLAADVVLYFIAKYRFSPKYI